MKVLILLSGGMDSATVLGRALAMGHEIETLSIRYGSKHNHKEMTAARLIADHYMVPWDLVDLTEIFSRVKSDLLTEGGDIPEGHYEAESMRRTVVPGRNLLMLATCAAIAESRESEEIWLGIHSGDHHIYPDCRPQFYVAASEAIRFSTDNKVHLVAPFLFNSKIGIIYEGMGLGVPYDLTWTCYKGGKIACGRCGSCQERLIAFEANGYEDPLEYESRKILPKEAR